MSYPPKTLVVDRFSSSCGDCGKSADPSSKGHYVLLGWGPTHGNPGCGVEWENVTTNYAGPSMEEATKNLRPDLNYIREARLLD
jgi:hypothetical protein